jgi:hypothetical protein
MKFICYFKQKSLFQAIENVDSKVGVKIDRESSPARSVADEQRGRIGDGWRCGCGALTGVVSWWLASAVGGGVAGAAGGGVEGTGEHWPL